jgi:hypothetical protein
VPLAAVAVMVQAIPGAELAEYRPVESIDPHVLAQVAGWFAVNCCDRPWLVVAVEGVMTNGEVTVTEVDATCELPSVEVAVTMHVPLVSGAVYEPWLGSMVPQDAVNVAAMLVVNGSVSA